MGGLGRFLVGVVFFVFLGFGCQNPESKKGVLADSGFGEHGQVTRSEKDRGPFITFENAHTLLLSFFSSKPIQNPETNISICYRIFSNFADRSAADAKVLETPDDSCVEQTNGWVKVAFTRSVDALNAPISTGFSADTEWIFHFGNAQEDESILNLRLDDYFAGHYRALIEGLSASTKYEYRVVYNGEKLANRVVFETPPEKKSDVAFDFAAVADLRSYDGPSQQANVLSQLETAVLKNGIRFVILPGDVSNESGTSSEYIEHYFKIYDSIQRMTPFYPVQGNHDLGSSAFLGNKTGEGRYFFRMMDMPRNAVAEEIQHWDPLLGRQTTGYRSFYSFDWGSAHFVALDRSAVETNVLGFEGFGKGSEQYEWLKENLDAAQSARWRIVYFHAPPAKENGTPTAELMALLKQKNVDLIIAGHAERPSLSLDDPETVPWVVLPSGGSRAKYFTSGSAADCVLDHKKRFGIATFHVEQNRLQGVLISSQGDQIAQFEIRKPTSSIRAERPSFELDAENCPSGL